MKHRRVYLFILIIVLTLLAVIADIFFIWNEYKKFYYFFLNEETSRVESVVKGTISAGGDPVGALDNYLKRSKILKGVSYKLEGRNIFLPNSQISPNFISRTVKIPPFEFTLYYDVSKLLHFKEHLIFLAVFLLILTFIFVAVLFLLLKEYYREKLERINEKVRRKNLEVINLAIHSIVHEVKNRLNVLRLLIYRYNSTKSEIYINRMKKEIEELSRYIEETSDLRKPISLDKERRNIGEVLKQVVNEFNNLFLSKNIKFNLSVEDLEFPFDEKKISSAVIDILKNAVEALDSTDGKQKEIRVVGKKDRNRYILEICDNSPLELPETLFEPFYSTKEKGFGIGLYNVKRIVEAHGGRVSAEKREGWSIFRMELPIG
ncbi:Signal transduction histidine kinase [Balnearium lithotrophicum]|uniref:histidine kinase n=1 Tax=Balnearium lithotrophicum TaxID=223788 RepID=A0A521B212_9BACT|nr:HAMP domain-containing sensor histidine kinase [Balnearium lithotrophicum]SMO41086.1 Signal transduction histidine kinase [Balnearium lithotrophicum]